MYIVFVEEYKKNFDRIDILNKYIDNKELSIEDIRWATNEIRAILQNECVCEQAGEPKYNMMYHKQNCKSLLEKICEKYPQFMV